MSTPPDQRSALRPAPPSAADPTERDAFARVAGIWLAGRAVNLLLLWTFFQISRSAPWGFGPEGEEVPDFLSFLTGWDADRYGTIAEEGYPTVLPTNPQGDILPNNWAFLPVFPLLIRGLSALSTLSWQASAVLLGLAAGLGATWMLFLLVRAVAPARPAMWAVVVFSFAPLSFLMVLGYSEGLFLLLTFAALLLAVRRRYAFIAPLGVAAAFTRPGALALALALGILFALRFARRRSDPFPGGQAAGLFVSGVVTAAAGLTWPVVADAVTGIRNAYIRTETGWWLESVGNDHFIPFTPWFRQAGMHLGPGGIVLVVLIVVAFAALLRSRGARALGPVILAYALSYGLYLFAVFLPQQSTFRLLMPLSPLLAHDRLSAGPRRRAATLAVCIVLQVPAVAWLWTLGHP